MTAASSHPALLMQLFKEGQAELEAMLWEAVQETDEEDGS